MTLENKKKKLSNGYFGKITEIRRAIHANPELSFHEFKTSELIAEQLKQAGIESVKCGKTGLYAVISGKSPIGKTVALRADMDALPLNENNNLPYKSKNPGVMHACGHDIHTASLLGAAFIINELRDEFNGHVKLIFQPGEEVLPGGAKMMIEEDVLLNPDVDLIIGQHIMPELASGTVGFRKGIFMASADEIYITVNGQGGHAAMPWKLVDPVLITAHLIIALQHIVRRNVITVIPSVLSFGKINASGSTNVIPDVVTIAGTLRTLDEKTRDEIHEKIYQITDELTRSMGGTAEIEIRKGYPSLANNEELTERCRDYAVKFLGKENVSDLDIRMTSDDFAYFANEVPGCYYRLGINTPGNENIPALHNSNFIADENSLKTGMGLMAFITINELDK
ncbi:MAG: M20 family metallopeptidase [Bacteroidia bacterium]|nr:M20 family metallopeptidase [Bacteroidia bacterium]